VVSQNQTLVYTASGGGKQIGGSRYVLSNDPTHPTAEYLRGRDIMVDSALKIRYLPQFDMESASPVGVPQPLVVFIYTNHSIPGIPTCLKYTGATGVFTCTKEKAHLFKNSPFSILWVTEKRAVHQIIKAEDKITATAKVVTVMLADPSKAQLFFKKLLFIVKKIIGAIFL